MFLMEAVAVMLPWHVLSPQMVVRGKPSVGAGYQVGFQQLSTVATCTSKTSTHLHVAPCLHSSAETLSYHRAKLLQGSSIHTTKATVRPTYSGYTVVI